MKNSSDLFNLIKTLTKSEKRYFITNNKSEAVYLKLFREIEKQSRKGVYNENAIKEKYRNEKFVRQLTYTKNYLYGLISECLIRYHRKDSIESYIYSLIISAKIFFSKSLFENYFKNIDKAKLLAEKYERFGILLEMISLQKYLIRAKDLNKIRLGALEREEKDVLARLNNLSEYKKIDGNINALIKRINNTGSRQAILSIEKIFQHKLLRSEKAALTVQAKDIFYDLKIFERDFNGEPGGALEYLLKKKNNYTENEEIFRINVNFQMSTITFNLAAYYLDAGNIREFERYFNYYKGIKIKDNITGLINDLDANSLSLRFIFLRRNVSDFKEYAASVLKYLQDNQDKITKDYLLSVYYNISVLQFNSGDIDNSLNTLNLLTNHKYKNFRKDLLNGAKLLALFIHFELGNFDLLENLIRALKRGKHFTAAQKVVANYMTQLINPKNKKQRSILTDFRVEILKLKKDRFEKHIFRLFDPQEWLNKKLSVIFPPPFQGGG